MKGDPLETLKKFGKVFEKIIEKRNYENFEQSHSAEKLERGDTLGFLKLQFAATYQKNLKGRPFGDKKIRKKVAQC